MEQIRFQNRSIEIEIVYSDRFCYPMDIRVQFKIWHRAFISPILSITYDYHRLPIII